jgi:hypothetical protein
MQAVDPEVVVLAETANGSATQQTLPMSTQPSSANTTATPTAAIAQQPPIRFHEAQDGGRWVDKRCLQSGAREFEHSTPLLPATHSEAASGSNFNARRVMSVCHDDAIPQLVSACTLPLRLDKAHKPMPG